MPAVGAIGLAADFAILTDRAVIDGRSGRCSRCSGRSDGKVRWITGPALVIHTVKGVVFGGNDIGVVVGDFAVYVAMIDRDDDESK